MADTYTADQYAQDMQDLQDAIDAAAANNTTTGTTGASPAVGSNSDWFGTFTKLLGLGVNTYGTITGAQSAADIAKAKADAAAAAAAAAANAKTASSANLSKYLPYIIGAVLLIVGLMWFKGRK